MTTKQLLYIFNKSNKHDIGINFVKLIKKLIKTYDFDHDFIFCVNYIKLMKEFKYNIKMKERIKHNNLIKKIKNLSDKFLINQIFLWLIPNINNIVFKYYYPTIGGWTSTNYNYKYQLAENINIKLSGSKLLLSRICKKNDKYRYYLTEETIIKECDVCLRDDCDARYCRGQVHKLLMYISKYIDNDLFKALFYFYYP